MWHGDADAIVPRHHADYVVDRLPKAELHVPPATGHLHTAERWQAFLGARSCRTSVVRAQKP